MTISIDPPETNSTVSDLGLTNKPCPEYTQATLPSPPPSLFYFFYTDCRSIAESSALLITTRNKRYHARAIWKAGMVTSRQSSPHHAVIRMIILSRGRCTVRSSVLNLSVATNSVVKKKKKKRENPCGDLAPPPPRVGSLFLWNSFHHPSLLSLFLSQVSSLPTLNEARAHHTTPQHNTE